MEFGFTEAHEKLRKEVHDFFMNELPSDHYPQSGVRSSEEHEKFQAEFVKKAARKGYTSAGWPKKYGGLGFTSIEQGIVSEQMSYWGMVWPGALGFSLVAPVILTAGTDEQKERFVSPIARGESICFECFTEPNAGSDEANVQMRAVEDGDHYILNGQKTFISGGQKPDWLYTLARTSETIPPHRGLSIFMVPGDAEGVSYRPLPTMGGSRQNEIFYDNVRVPRENLIGEKDRGFYLAMTTFEFERAAVSPDARTGLRRLVEFCRKEKKNGRPLIEDPHVRKMLARMAMHQQVMWLLGWYAAWRRTAREKMGPLSYDLTMFMRKQWAPTSANLLMNTLGMYGQLEPDSRHAKYNGAVGRSWEASRMIHAAGTPEILQVVIANRGLGLPRVPRKFNAMINEALSEG